MAQFLAFFHDQEGMAVEAVIIKDRIAGVEALVMQRFPPQAPVRRDSQEQFFPEKFDIIQVPMPCRLNDDRKIRLSLDGEIFQFPRRPFFQADIDVRIAFVDDGNSPRQDGRTAIIGTADAHGAANGLPQILDTLFPDLAQVLDLPFDVQIDTPGFGQGHRLMGTVKEFRTDMALDAADELAQRRLGDV